MTNVTTWSAYSDESLTHWGSQQSQAPQALQSLTLDHLSTPAQHTAPESHRVHTGALSMNAASGVVESAGQARCTVSHDGNRGDPITSTLQRQGGMTSVELIPGQPASRTDIRTAIREGLVKEARPGVYEDISAQEVHRLQPQQAPQQPQQQDPGAEVFSPTEDRALAAAIAPVPQHAYDAAVASVTNAVTTGGDLSKAAQALAGNASMDPAEAAQLVEAVHAHYERVVSRAVAPLGITGARKEAFYAYARTEPQLLQQAVQSLTWGRDPAGFKGLAATFNRKHPAA